MTTRARAGKALRIAAAPLRVFAWIVASVGRLAFALLILLAFVVWALGTRGVPFTAEVAQKVMGGELTVAHAEGGLFGPIVLEGIVLDNASARTEIDRLRLEWSPGALWKRQVQIDLLEVGRIVVQQKETPPSEPKPLTPNLPRDVLVEQARVAHFELRPVDGEPLVFDAITAKASWLKDQIEIAHLAATHAQSGAVQARGAAQLAAKSITVQSLHLEGPAVLDAQGVVGLMGTPSDLRATLAQGRWPLQGDAQFTVPELVATARGVLTGATMDIALTLQGAARTAVQAKKLGFDIDAALQLGSRGAHIERLWLKSLDGAGTLTAEGDAEWKPALRVDAKAIVQKLDPGVLLPEWKGQLNGELTAATRNEGALPVVDFGASLVNSKLRGYPLKLDARGTAALQGETRRLELAAFALTSGSTTIKAEGAVLPQLDLAAKVNAADLKSLLPSLGGAVQLDAKLAGEPANPAIQAKGSARGLRYENNTLATASVDLDYQPAGESRARLDARGLAFGETQLAAASLDAAGRAEQHRVALEATLAQPKSKLALNLEGAADVAARQWQGRLAQSTFTPPYGPVWQQEAAGALSLAAAAQRLEPTCWKAGAARLCLDATLAPPSTRIAYRLEKLETMAFAALLPKDWIIETTLDGTGEIALEGAVPQTLNLDLKAGAGRLLLPEAPPLRLLPSTLAVRQLEGRWQGKADLALDRGTLAADVSLPMAGAALTERALSGHVKVDVPDLSWLSPLIPQVQDLRGRLDGDFAVAGSASAPKLDGTLHLVDGGVRIEAAGIVLKDITAEVRGGNAGALAITGSATSGGVVKFDGTVDFAGGKPQVKLGIKGQDVQVADIADARVWVSPDLVYAQDAEGMKLSGTVKVPKADITPRKLQANAVGASADQVLVGVDAPVKKTLPLSAEVTVQLGDKVTFEGFGLKAKVEGSVTALDTPGSGGTRGRGELRLVDAAYKAYGQEIQVETGRILFNGGPIGEPTIDLVARRSPREDVSVSLHVRGTLDQPTFDLSSSPAMPREQQLGWLLFGRPIDSAAGGDFSAASAALSLGIAGGDALASRIGKVIGLDQVSLGADATSTTWQSTSSTLPGQPGTDQTRFTIGKYLSPKLFVSYGVGLFDNGNVLRLLYDLGRGFKLRTETATEQSGGDLLYSVDR